MTERLEQLRGSRCSPSCDERRSTVAEVRRAVRGAEPAACSPSTDSPAPGCSCITEGTVRSTSRTRAGRARAGRVRRRARRSWPTACRAWLGSEPARPVKGVAIGRAAFADLLRREPSIAVGMLPVLARRLADAERRASGVASRTISPMRTLPTRRAAPRSPPAACSSGRARRPRSSTFGESDGAHERPATDRRAPAASTHCVPPCSIDRFPRTIDGPHPPCRIDTIARA